jgi:uncharacterized membrane protein
LLFIEAGHYCLVMLVLGYSFVVESFIFCASANWLDKKTGWEKRAAQQEPALDGSK